MAAHGNTGLEHLAGIGIGEDEPVRVGRIVGEIGDGPAARLTMRNMLGHMR